MDLIVDVVTGEDSTVKRAPSSRVPILRHAEPGNSSNRAATIDESTVAGWAVDLRQILAGAIREPDRDWRLLPGPGSRRENRE